MQEGKFMIPFGSVFLATGLFIGSFAFNQEITSDTKGGALVFIIFGLVFGGAGLAVMIAGIKAVIRAQEVLKNGKRYTGKIFRYESDPSMRINERPALMPVVRFFDESGAIKEAWVKVSSIDQRKYAIGNTMEVAVTENAAEFVKKSYNRIKKERIPGEEQLMAQGTLSQRVGIENAGYIQEYNFRTGSYEAPPAANTPVDILCPGCSNAISMIPGTQGNCPYCNRLITFTYERMIQ